MPPDGWLRDVRAACTDANVLFALDEIQTGLGRTGKMFAWEHERARPDLIVLGKALSGGVLPVSCVAADDALMSVFTPGSHGSTFGGSPLAAAVCVAALDVLVDERLAERSAELGARALTRLRKDLSGRPGLTEVRGRGLFLGVEYRRPVAHDVSLALASVGVLAKDTRDNVVRFAPPLVISEAHLDEALGLATPVLARFADA